MKLYNSLILQEFLGTIVPSIFALNMKGSQQFKVALFPCSHALTATIEADNKRNVYANIFFAKLSVLAI